MTTIISDPPETKNPSPHLGREVQRLPRYHPDSGYTKSTGSLISHFTAERAGGLYWKLTQLTPQFVRIRASRVHSPLCGCRTPTVRAAVSELSEIGRASCRERG